MIVKRMGETVMLSCINNNPPTLASMIRWVQNGEVLQSLSLTEDLETLEENTVTYTTQADEDGVYQCQVLSARNNSTLLVVNVTLTVETSTMPGTYQPAITAISQYYSCQIHKL